MKGKQMKHLVVAALSAVSIAIAISPADAHAVLKAAGPAPGSVITSSPKAIRIQFNEAVEIAFTGIELKNQNGQAQPVGTPTLNPKDKAQLIVPVNEDLTPGKYTVSWHAVGDDTHKTEGSFNFELKK
jgi:methionine-rich copper-binding protein CopC